MSDFVMTEVHARGNEIVGDSGGQCGPVAANDLASETVPISDYDMTAAWDWYEAQMARVRSGGPFSVIQTITPARATVLLDRNPDNRPLRINAVRRYAEALVRGEWELNGEALIVAASGELNGGQHRCHAVRHSGVPMTTWMVWGVSRESRMTEGIGMKRSPGNFLAMEGVPNPNNVAAALRILVNLEEGAVIGTGCSIPRLREALAEHPDIQAFVHSGRRLGREFGISGAACTALLYWFATFDRPKAEEFGRLVATGDEHPDASGIRLLRTRLIRNLRQKEKLPNTELAALFIKAFNAFATGRVVATLRWRTAGDASEPFPQVQVAK